MTIALQSRYEIIETLNQGDSGARYKAYDRELQRVVSLTVLNYREPENPEQLAHLRERLLAASREHGMPHILGFDSLPPISSHVPDGTFSDVHVISIVWLVMIGDLQGKGNFPSVPRHLPTVPRHRLLTGENRGQSPGTPSRPSS